MSGLNTADTLAAIESHALALGRFERVNRHEPKVAPGNGLRAAIWAQNIRPHARASGLAATSARVTWNVRIYSNMLAEPQDGIDPEVLDATDQLFAAYAGDFTLGGEVMAVDLLGTSGDPLMAVAGYITIDKAAYRVMTITLPILIADAWEQVA